MPSVKLHELRVRQAGLVAQRDYVKQLLEHSNSPSANIHAGLISSAISSATSARAAQRAKIREDTLAKVASYMRKGHGDIDAPSAAAGVSTLADVMPSEQVTAPNLGSAVVAYPDTAIRVKRKATATKTVTSGSTVPLDDGGDNDAGFGFGVTTKNPLFEELENDIDDDDENDDVDIVATSAAPAALKIFHAAEDERRQREAELQAIEKAREERRVQEEARQAEEAARRAEEEAKREAAEAAAQAEAQRIEAEKRRIAAAEEEARQQREAEEAARQAAEAKRREAEQAEAAERQAQLKKEQERQLELQRAFLVEQEEQKQRMIDKQKEEKRRRLAQQEVALREQAIRDATDNQELAQFHVGHTAAHARGVDKLGMRHHIEAAEMVANREIVVGSAEGNDAAILRAMQKTNPKAYAEQMKGHSRAMASEEQRKMRQELQKAWAEYESTMPRNNGANMGGTTAASPTAIRSDGRLLLADADYLLSLIRAGVDIDSEQATSQGVRFHVDSSGQKVYRMSDVLKLSSVGTMNDGLEPPQSLKRRLQNMSDTERRKREVEQRREEAIVRSLGRRKNHS